MLEKRLLAQPLRKAGVDRLKAEGLNDGFDDVSGIAATTMV
ncbi:hypothetical protein [Planktotalea arctica]